MVARLINFLSGTASGLAVMFLFWIITYMSKKIYTKNGEELTQGNMYAVLGSGVVGAMAFTFCDSFWFSAVEGIVWAMASFFTSAIFWSATKWDRETDIRNSYRWIILIGFLIGLSIGVHLLNLLAIPAIGFLYYFKNYKPSWKGILLATVISMGITGAIFGVVIPQVVDLFAKTELLFVNGLGMPFNFGTLFLALLFIALIGGGVLYTIKENLKPIYKTILLILCGIFVLLILIGSTSAGSFVMRLIVSGLLVTLFYFMRNKKAAMNTLILTFAFLLMGYSTYLILVIRSNAQTPLNENSPKNAIALLSYLNREQYGEWPVLYGQYYNAPVNPQNEWKDGSPLYSRDEKAGKYVMVDDRKKSIPTYDPRFCTPFTRMWSSDESLGHPDGYKSWGSIKGTPISITDPETGKAETIMKPTFGENIKYFFNYQIGHMYLRYFLWNFVGRQSDIQNTDGNPLDGNWYSGIKPIDNRLGPQDELPDNMKHNKGMHYFYFLPLILGFIGFIFHLNKRSPDTLVVATFFFMTGIAIVLYLNQYPNQPRERDYSYSVSMMAFCIWIGIGVVAIYEQLKKYIKPVLAAGLTTVVCFACVPYVMGSNGWAGHDRSKRYTMVDFASNYLNSCAPNAIIFTNGDNDTFPLWYAQEVEGIRTDVRVVNLSLLNTDWYIDAMKRKAYDSDPVPFSLTWNQYKEGTRDYVYFIPDSVLCKPNQYYNLKQLMNFVASDDPQTKFQSSRGNLEYFPTKNLSIPVDKETVLKNGTVPQNLADSIVPAIEWTCNRNGVQKADLMILDLLANNNWKRPVYFASTSGSSTFLGLDKYLKLEGLAYRLMPVKSKKVERGEVGSVNADVMYNNMMTKFKWGNIQDTTLYFDETVVGMAQSHRLGFSELADALSEEGKKDQAIKVLDKCQEILPEKNVEYNYYEYLVGQSYYNAGAVAKGNKIMNRLIDIFEQDLKYYFKFSGSKAESVDYHKQRAIGIMQRIAQAAYAANQEDVAKKAKSIADKYYSMYSK
jgi:tetratricopeptide (TPR) repeat protein